MVDSNTENFLRQIDMDGFCIVEGVIPEHQIEHIRDEIMHAEREQHDRTEADRNRTRSRGHRVSAKGVSALRQLINYTQCFESYVADKRIMGIVEGVFGPWSRISCTDCIINEPGNDRAYWHADWPYNRTNASHISPPYPDTPMHLSTIWMLSDFSEKNGGTLVIPGSHRMRDNPASGHMSISQNAPYPTEINVSGTAGSVFVADSRLWHSTAPNHTNVPRPAILIRYAPWWLNLNPTHIGKVEHKMMVVETKGKNYEQEPIQKNVYEGLSETVKPLYRHWIEA